MVTPEGGRDAGTCNHCFLVISSMNEPDCFLENKTRSRTEAAGELCSGFASLLVFLSKANMIFSGFLSRLENKAGGRRGTH